MAPRLGGRATIAVLGLALALLGAVVVARFPIWAPVDERAHYEFVQSLAEDGRLPEIDDVGSPEAQAIADRSWPRPSPVDPATQGLAGRSYEAFQPPLYYVLATPAYALIGDHRDKVFAVRVLDLLLYAIGAAMLALLARRLAPAGRRAPVLAAGLLVLAWPGLIVRGITISNTALEFALAPAFLLAAWRAHEERSARWLLAAGALFGACLLTKLTLVVLGPCLLLAACTVAGFDLGRRRPAVAAPPVRNRRAALAALALPVAALAPWLIVNHARIGTWTANAAARDQQTPFLYPRGVPDWGLGDLPARAATLLHGTVPQEWDRQLDVWWVGIAARALVVVFVLAAVLAAASGDSAARRRIGFFALPVVTGLAFIAYTLLAENWDIFLLRYVGALLAPLALVVAAAVPAGRVRAVGIPMAVVTAALWVDLAGAFLFTDVGGKLGI
ncbi:MAG: hypothetical protein QOF76_3595 [Solirubrobacteraceae bacterium]|jgi:4-amino-4-deoxy-L-arabinose transferase-like glycosyltransferase|nr:hypothetical protein [Solirubrobacteraceae bacterium]